MIGGSIGLVTARRIQMTAMPQLVAAFHSLVGMAAVLVGAAAFSSQCIRDHRRGGAIISVSRLELGLGVAIGAITFSGSVIAFLKLNGNMSGKPTFCRKALDQPRNAVGDPVLHYGFFDSQSPIDFGWSSR